MDVTVCPCVREGHMNCVILRRMKHLSETEESIDFVEVNTLIEAARVRERLLRESRQMLEQRRMRDLMSEKMGRR